MLTAPQRELLSWERREYRRRTRLIREGKGQIDWLVPQYRVTWTEVCAKAEELGLDPYRHVVDFRLWWDTARRERLDNPGRRR